MVSSVKIMKNAGEGRGFEHIDGKIDLIFPSVK